MAETLSKDEALKIAQEMYLKGVQDGAAETKRPPRTVDVPKSFDAQLKAVNKDLTLTPSQRDLKKRQMLNDRWAEVEKEQAKLQVKRELERLGINPEDLTNA